MRRVAVASFELTAALGPGFNFLLTSQVDDWHLDRARSEIGEGLPIHEDRRLGPIGDTRGEVAVEDRFLVSHAVDRMAITHVLADDESLLRTAAQDDLP